jgi:hypothetical protein
VRHPHGGGLMTREKPEDSRHESEGDGCSGKRHIYCDAIAESAYPAHRYIPSSAVISSQAFTTRHSSLSSLTIRSRAAQGMNKGTWQNLLHNAFT